MSELNALVGVDFSLLKTKMYAAYEKNGNDGYSVLLMPTAQESDNSVSLDEIIEQIKTISTNKEKNDNTESADDVNMKAQINQSLNNFDITDKDVKFKLCMAYLYLDKKNGEDAKLEYAFKLEILMENVVPDAIKDIIDVNRLMISVWKTDRPQVINEMALISVKEFIEG